MSLPYSKPPPYERPNWNRMNAGQQRYAMEQYNLALVRRGARFESPQVEEDEPETVDIASQHSNHSEHDAIHDLDELDKLLDELPGSQGGDKSTTGASTSAPSDTATSSRHHINTSQEAGPSSAHQPMDTPPPTPLKRTADEAIGGSSKKQNTGTSGSALPGTSGNTDGMVGGNATGEDSSRAIANIPKGIHTPTYHWTFQKKWKFLSFGVANQIIAETLTTGTTPLQRFCLTTSMVNVPWEYAFFYMSPAELTRIQQFNGVFAKRAHIKIYQYNPRVAFQTADTTSTQATLNQNKFTRTAIGLRSNANLYGSDRDYTFDGTEPMKPTGIEPKSTGQDFRAKLAEYMYGVPQSNANFRSYVPAVVTGGELALLRYYTCYTSADNSTTYGFPQYNKFINEYNSMDLIGKSVLECEHEFSYAPLKARARNTQNKVFYVGDSPDTLPGTLDKQLVITDGTNLNVNFNRDMPPDGSRIPGITLKDYAAVPLQRGSANDGYDSTNLNYANVFTKFPMEQAGAYGEANGKSFAYKEHPSVHVGVRAVPKLGTAVNDIQPTSWLDTQMYWTVEATLEVSAGDPFTYPLDNVLDIAARSQYCVSMGEKNIGQVHTYDRPFVYGRAMLVDNTTTL